MARSVLGAKVYDLPDALDMGIALRVIIGPILKFAASIYAFKDSKSLFDTITKVSQIAEKRLLIDVSAIREAFITRGVVSIGWMRSNYDIADPLTKLTRSNCLDQLLFSGTL